MANIKIPGLTPKSTAAGIRWYWQPSATLKRAGWKSLPLGADQAAAIAAAQARNVEIATWRAGGATPKQIDRHAKRATVAALIKRYRTERLPELGENTRKTYGSALTHIEKWAGTEQASAITPKNVRTLRDAMMKVRKDGTTVLGHHAAHNTLKVGRTLFAWGARQEGYEALKAVNPFEGFDLATPAPRNQIWDDADVAAFGKAAIALGFPSMGYAVELAAWIGQRESDMIALTEHQWKEMPPLEETVRAALAGPDGRVMALELLQKKKTGSGGKRRWIAVPLAGEIRARTEAAIAANHRGELGTVTLLVNDATGTPWQQRHFIRVFDQVRDRAIKDGRASLADLQFRDLRRTCVVRLGRLGLNDAQISAISGHQLETTKRILETYMPRDHAMAASAIVATIGRKKQPELAPAKAQR